jgi:hypothetical protein
MNLRTDDRDHRFLTGLALGGIVGAGLAVWLAPRAAEIRERTAASAKILGGAVADHFRGARLRVTDAADGISRRGQALRNDACDTVVRAAQKLESGARDLQHLATDAKTNVG